MILKIFARLQRQQFIHFLQFFFNETYAKMVWGTKCMTIFPSCPATNFIHYFYGSQILGNEKVGCTPFVSVIRLQSAGF